MKKLLRLILASFVIVNIFLLLFIYNIQHKSDLRYHQVAIQSDSPTFSVHITDNNFLQKDLPDRFSFWQNQAVHNFRNGREATVTSLNIHLTNTGIDKTKLVLNTSALLPNGKNDVVEALGQEFNEKSGQMDIYTYINPYFMNTMKDEQLDKFVVRQILSSLYTLTNPPNADSLGGLETANNTLLVNNKAKTFLHIKK